MPAYDKLAADAGAVNYDSLATAAGGTPAVTVKEHTRSQPGFLKRLARTQAKNLPAYGATIGAALGAPALAAGQLEVPVGLAMAGGAAGKAVEQALSGPLGVEGPSGPMEAYKQQANAAALQGAFEGIPTQWVQPGVKAVTGAFAKSQMAKALAPAKALVRNFPTVVEDALRQGASVNRWFGKGGVRAADQVRNAATANVVRLLRTATRRGASVDIAEVAQPIVQAVERKAGKLNPVDHAALLQSVQDRADELLLKSVLGAKPRSSAAMTPLMADELRKAAARASRATLGAEAAGLPTTAIPDMDRLIAKGASSAVKRIPFVASARAAEQTAIGVSRAVRESEIRPTPAAVGVGLGPIKAGIGVPPGLASRMALLSAAL